MKLKIYKKRMHRVMSEARKNHKIYIGLHDKDRGHYWLMRMKGKKGFNPARFVRLLQPSFRNGRYIRSDEIQYIRIGSIAKETDI